MCDVRCAMCDVPSAKFQTWGVDAIALQTDLLHTPDGAHDIFSCIIVLCLKLSLGFCTPASEVSKHNRVPLPVLANN
jgi:hypothetical protein